MNRLTRTTIVWSIAIVAALAVGVGCFWGARMLLADDPEAKAEQRGPFWYAPYFEEDSKKPRFNQVVNGILVGPSVPEPSSGLCIEIGVGPEYVSPERAVGTLLDVSPAYLPEGVKLSPSPMAVTVVECGGAIVLVMKEYDVPNKPSAGDPNFPAWAGGNFHISRFLTTSTDSFPLSGAAERIGPIYIEGKRGVLERPVMPDGVDAGMDNVTIVIPEDSGLTVVEGHGLPLAEFIRIAESLYQEEKR
jgi:hypothetical protein